MDNLEQEAVYALLDVLEGQRVHDIVAMTGLSEARCEEISRIYWQCIENFGKGWKNSRGI